MDLTDYSCQILTIALTYGMMPSDSRKLLTEIISYPVNQPYFFSFVIWRFLTKAIFTWKFTTKKSPALLKPGKMYSCNSNFDDWLIDWLIVSFRLVTNISCIFRIRTRSTKQINLIKYTEMKGKWNKNF